MPFNSQTHKLFLDMRYNRTVINTQAEIISDTIIYTRYLIF